MTNSDGKKALPTAAAVDEPRHHTVTHALDV
jgi:hypothetical protein